MPWRQGPRQLGHINVDQFLFHDLLKSIDKLTGLLLYQAFFFSCNQRVCKYIIDLDLLEFSEQPN